MSGVAYNFMGPALERVIPCPMVFDNTTCTGLPKLLEKVIVLFLKDKETSTNSDMGTLIVDMLGAGNNLMSGEMTNYLNLAASTVKANMVNPNDPLDEQIDSLSVQAVQDPANKGHVLVTIRVVSKAGAAAITTVKV
jgi:hypothetical protein